MKRLVLVLAAAAAVLPSAASSAACSPLNCAASQFTLAQGTLLGFRTSAHAPVTIVDLATGETRFALPSGVTGGRFLVHQVGRTLTWYDATTGKAVHAVTLAHRLTLRGVSQDGVRAVVRRLVSGATHFTVVSPDRQRTVVVPGGNWDFDGLRGDNLFLIKYLRGGGYQVRLAHVDAGRLERAVVKDPRESGTIWGSPYSRLASADGRYLFTLYIGSNGGSMIHELDLLTAKARCIDLPGAGDYGSATSYALVLSADQRTLWALSPGYGRAAAIDVRTRAVKDAFSFTIPAWSLGGGTSAALAPDGRRVALSDSGHSVAVVDLVKHAVAQHEQAHAVALGFAPDGRLWKFV